MIKVIGHNENVGSYVLAPDGKSSDYSHAELERGQERALRFSMASRQLRWLQGEILTILEASMSEGGQLKATKDLVKDTFSRKISWVYELCGCPEEEQHGLVNTGVDL